MHTKKNNNKNQDPSKLTSSSSNLYVFSMICHFIYFNLCVEQKVLQKLFSESDLIFLFVNFYRKLIVIKQIKTNLW